MIYTSFPPKLAAKKLKRMGYIATLSNITGAAISEKPDAIGIDSSGESFLVEVKVSRSDFMADKKKPHRNKDLAIGNYRAYLAPEGLLKPEEIPYGWQLWEVKKGKRPTIKVVKGEVVKKVYDERGISPWPKNEWSYPYMSEEEHKYFLDKCHYRAINGLLAVILSRADDEEIDIQKLATRNGKGFKS